MIMCFILFFYENLKVFEIFSCEVCNVGSIEVLVVVRIGNMRVIQVSVMLLVLIKVV